VWADNFILGDPAGENQFLENLSAIPTFKLKQWHFDSFKNQLKIHYFG
jgi:hypothetical protein